MSTQKSEKTDTERFSPYPVTSQDENVSTNDQQDEEVVMPSASDNNNNDDLAQYELENTEEAQLTATKPAAAATTTTTTTTTTTDEAQSSEHENKAEESNTEQTQTQTQTQTHEQHQPQAQVQNPVIPPAAPMVTPVLGMQQQQQQMYPYTQSYTPAVSQAQTQNLNYNNNNPMQQQQQEHNNDANNPYRNVYINGEQASKCVHFRNVISSITVQDIQMLCGPFTAEPVKIVMMRGKNQCIAQFSTYESAINFVQFYTDNPCQVRNRRVYAKFSRHSELRENTTAPGRVLLVTLQADYPLMNLNIDSLWQLFCNYGFIEKIVLVRRKESADELAQNPRALNSRQALIQFSQQYNAANAIQALNGQIVLCGEMQLNLTLQYSNLSELIVKQQGPDARDYMQLYQQQVLAYQTGVNSSATALNRPNNSGMW